VDTADPCQLLGQLVFLLFFFKLMFYRFFSASSFFIDFVPSKESSWKVVFSNTKVHGALQFHSKR
jgi:hypothetical protein